MKQELKHGCLSRFAESPVFGDADREAVLAVLSAEAEAVEIKKGETIYIKESLCCLASGRAAVAASGSDSTVMKKLLPGDVFGCSVLFGGEAVTDILALSDCIAVTVSKQAVCRIFDEVEGAAVGYIRFLSEKIRYLNGRISDLAAKGTDERLLSFIKKATSADGRLKISVTDLSKRIGVGRTSLYRSLTSLTEQGLITRSKGIITINIKEK